MPISTQNDCTTPPGTEYMKIVEWPHAVGTFDAETLARVKHVREENEKKDKATLEDRVTFSSEAMKAAAQYEQAQSKGATLDTLKTACIEGILIEEGRGNYPENITSPKSGFQTTTKNGTVVGVYSDFHMKTASYINCVQITQQSGMQIKLVVNENMRINESANGDITVFYGDTHKKITYSPDGNIMESLETEGSISGTAEDDIIINLTGSLVDGKEGDDSIFNLADTVTILGGSGNDSIFVPGKITNSNIDTGEGNDTVIGSYIDDSTIDLGAGDNNIAIGSMRETHLKTGDGNNGVYLGSIATNSSVEIGDGNNGIYIGSISNNDSWIPNIETGSNVNIGDGNNIIHVSSLSFSTLNIGNGANEVHLTSSNGGTLKMGINSYRINSVPIPQNFDNPIYEDIEKQLTQSIQYREIFAHRKLYKKI